MILNKENLINKDTCKHPLWFKFGQYTSESIVDEYDDIIFDVKCVVCGLRKEASFNDFEYVLNQTTGVYDTNIIKFEDIIENNNLDPEVIYEVVRIEFERFLNNYTTNNKEYVKKFINEYRGVKNGR